MSTQIDNIANVLSRKIQNKADTLFKLSEDAVSNHLAKMVFAVVPSKEDPVWERLDGTMLTTLHADALKAWERIRTERYFPKNFCCASVSVPIPENQMMGVAFKAVKLVVDSKHPPDWEAGDSDANPAFEKAFPQSEAPSDEARELALKIYRTVINEREMQDPKGLKCVAIRGLGGGGQPNTLWMNNVVSWIPVGEERIPVESLGNLVRGLLEYFELPPVTFQWVAYSSTAEGLDPPSKFSSGAVFVAAGQEIEQMNPAEWAKDRLENYAAEGVALQPS